MAKGPEQDFVVSWPTLWIVPDWIEAHCPIPDGFRAGEDLELYPWQLWCTANHYRVKPDAKVGQLATAFHYRRSQVVAPQKTGKGPWSAGMLCNEAAGPAVFAGWAKGGELYRCSDHGCHCGWWYRYVSGEPMGTPWPTPRIQLMGVSGDSVESNVYAHFRGMVDRGPLSEILRVGEEFTRIGRQGRLDVVTSSALSRVGNPINFALQDENGLYTTQNKLVKVADAQRRGLAGMGGRALGTTNAWDPSEISDARRTAESRRPDIFRYHPKAPAGLSYTNKAERRRIHRYVYAGSTHVDLDAIEAEVAELLERDPAQAERFFGNRSVAGSSSWLELAKWAARKGKPRRIADRTRIVLGFDGSDVDDWTAIRAETMDGYQFTPTFGPNQLPTIWNPADYGGQVPRLEVMAAMDELFRRFDVVRAYCDPPYWETEVDTWVELYGEKRVIRWHTRRPVQMHAACERLKTDVVKKDSNLTHDGCEITEEHVGNARAAARPMNRYVLAKASDGQKIDACVTSILAHEAAGDVIAAGLAVKKKSYVYTA